jgi:MFS family permease
VLAAIASFAVMAGVMNLTGYIVVGHHHAQSDVFTVISLHIVGMFGLVLVVGELVDRVGRRGSLIGGLAIMALSTAMLAWVASIPGMSASLYLLGLGWNVSYVAASAELVTHAEPRERGRLVGFTDLVAGLIAAALALLGGVVYTRWGVVALALGATAAVLAPGLAILVGRRRPAPAAAELAS